MRVIAPRFSTSAAVPSVAPVRPRRALLYMPGSSPKMLQKAQSLQVDTVCMDLEDAVAVGQKAEARDNIVRALNSWTDAKAERLGQTRGGDAASQVDHGTSSHAQLTLSKLIYGSITFALLCDFLSSSHQPSRQRVRGAGSGDGECMQLQLRLAAMQRSVTDHVD